MLPRIVHRRPVGLDMRCVNASFSSNAKKVSFSESVLRPFLKQTLRSVNETFSVGRRTLLETIMGGSLPPHIAAGGNSSSSAAAAAKHTTPVPSAVSQPVVVRTVAPTVAAAVVEAHPILGELICDMKYKRVYLTDIRSLVNATVWEKQRTLRHARAELIANTKIANNSLASLPGTITCYRHVATGNIGIFDGQHRVAALFLLSQKGLWNATERNILVEVFDVEDEVGEVMRLFREINSAEPVSLMDMMDTEDDAQVSAAGAVPGHASVAPLEALTNKQVKEIIDEACALLHEKYGETMFKPSKNCHPPHLNVDKLREDLFESDLLHDPALQIRSAKQLGAHIHRVNYELGLRSDEQWLAQAGAGRGSQKKKTALAKARKHGLFIGMDKMWLLTS